LGILDPDVWSAEDINVILYFAKTKISSHSFFLLLLFSSSPSVLHDTDGFFELLIAVRFVKKCTAFAKTCDIYVFPRVFASIIESHHPIKKKYKIQVSTNSSK
jgi:hypothetical protein